MVANRETEPVMNDLSKFWQWLLDENNRGALALVGVAFAAVVGAGWALFRHFRKREDGGTTTSDSGRSADEIKAIIEPFLASNKD